VVRFEHWPEFVESGTAAALFFDPALFLRLTEVDKDQGYH
jgi:hypothetical protein